MQNGEMHSHYLYFQIDFLTSISSVRHCLSAKNGKSPGLLESHAHPPKNHQAGAQVKKKKKGPKLPTTKRYHTTFTKVASVGKDVEKLEPLYIASRNVKCFSCSENVR